MLAQAMDRYFAVNLRITSDETKRQYRYALQDFARALGREPRVADLSDDNLLVMMRFLGDRKLAPKTINERVGRIRTLWTWCAKKQMVSDWPTSQKMREPRRIPVAFTVDEMRRLLDACHRQRGYVGGVPACLWWPALIRCAWASGERITALLALRWEHVDTSTGWIYLPAESRKGKAADARYRLDEATCRLLNMVIDPPRELVFAWPYDRTYIWTRFGSVLEQAGLPSDRRHKFHAIRRSVASYLHAAGGDACSAMGHSSPGVTQRYYLDPRITAARQPADLLPSLDG